MAIVKARTGPRRILALLSVMVSGALGCGEGHVRVDAKDAPAHDRARSFTLDGARVLMDKGGRYERICTGRAGPVSKGATPCVDHHFYVFPVVPAAWAPPAPVPAWVTCSSNEKSAEQCGAWVAANSASITGSVAVRVGDGDKVGRARSGWEDAIDDAAKRHGLAVTPRGPVLRLGHK